MVIISYLMIKTDGSEFHEDILRRFELQICQKSAMFLLHQETMLLLGHFIIACSLDYLIKLEEIIILVDHKISSPHEKL